MRLLLIAHLFKLSYVRRLLVAHLFKLCYVLCLLLAHLFDSTNALVGSAQLLSEHSVVLLHTLGYCSLALHFHIDSP